MLRNMLGAMLLAPLLVDAAINGSFTLTSWKPEDPKFNKLKVNYAGGLNLFQEKVRSYCPANVGAACPNGTATAWYNGLYPNSMVPGGQDSYVLANGLVLITPQHSHSKPSDAYWGYEGFRCKTISPAPPPTKSTDCPAADPLYDCGHATGLCEWKLSGLDEGGIYVCANPYDPAVASIFVKTPSFNQTGCVELSGLATHPYTNSTPVWSYI